MSIRNHIIHDEQAEAKAVHQKVVDERAQLAAERAKPKSQQDAKRIKELEKQLEADEQAELAVLDHIIDDVHQKLD